MQHATLSLAGVVPSADAERGKQIRKFRLAAGYSQEDIARAVDVSPRTVWSWEAGKGIHIANLRAVAKFLERSVEELDGRAETPEPFSVTRQIDQRLQSIADEFRDYVAGIVTHMQEHDEMVRDLLRRQSDVLERIEGLVATLPTEAGAEVARAIRGQEDQRDGKSRSGRGEDGPATPFHPAAEEQ